MVVLQHRTQHWFIVLLIRYGGILTQIAYLQFWWESHHFVVIYQYEHFVVMYQYEHFAVMYQYEHFAVSEPSYRHSVHVICVGWCLSSDQCRWNNDHNINVGK